MRYLDYERLCKVTDVSLRSFLLSVYEEDTIRRVRVAFPEFFTNEQPRVRNVRLADIKQRREALASNPSVANDYEELKAATFKWFGLNVYAHEYRADGEKQRGYELLPADFKRERDESYDGLFAEDRWVVNLVTEDCTEGQEHLVIEVLVTGDESPEYFIWSIPTYNIEF